MQSKKIKKIIFIYIILNIFLVTSSFAETNNYFLSLKYNKVNVRQGPSSDYPIKYIYRKKFLPLKVIDSYDNFKKVLDLSYNTGWIHRSQLSKKKTAINIKNNSLIFFKPEIYSKPIIKMEVGRLVLIKKCNIEWCKIKTDKYNGWVMKKTLWGRIN